MYTFTGPGSHYVQCIRLLALVVSMYNVQVYCPGSYQSINLPAPVIYMYNVQPDSYFVKCTRLLTLVSSMLNVHISLPW